MRELMKKATCVVGAAVLAAAAGSAWAFPGPDVIVGDLPDVSHWGNQSVNGVVIEAYSVGTTSCNVGDQPLLWIANTNQHPVISGNMFRLDPATSRFQQVGQSWLKHGFTALQGTVCFSDCDEYPNGTRLGVHCSDPYSSGLNGSQSGLGPKYQVNATTGNFAYPFAAGNGSGTIFKRLQVRRTDLQTPNALYFVTSQYIAPDDATNGNGLNNESYRRITVNTTNYDIALQDQTMRMRPGIYAWKDHGLGVGQTDPNVYINWVDVPNDGRYYVGSKAIDLGNGRWRYEYAVQNLNSHLSASSFSVPVPAAAIGTVGGAGFSDVNYHSGEPFNSIDWTTSVSGSAITFACTQSYAQNQNANALRWGTMYNFWFECDVPPAASSATLGMFRPGGAPSADVITVTPSPDGQSRPINDSCTFAGDVGAGATAFTTVGATTDGPVACTEFNYNQIGNDVWFRFVAPVCDSPVTVSTCGSGFDTKIAVYPDTGCPADGTHLACNDDDASCGANSLQSSVTFDALAGESFLIRVGGFNGATGTGTLTIDASNCAPANDACADAIEIVDNVALSGSTSLATLDGTATCGAAGTTPDVWYVYQSANAGQVRFNTCGSTYDTVLSVHTGTCGALSQVACNDDSGNNGPCANTLQSYISMNVAADTAYYLRVSGYNGDRGDYTITAVREGPSNDNCANRAGIGLGTTPFTTVGATTDGPGHAGCDFFGSNQVTNDIWFNYPSQCDGTLRIDTCNGTSFDTKLAVYSGNTCTDFDSRLLACSDDNCGLQTSIEIAVVAGNNYTIRVGGFDGSNGTGELTLTCTPAPACDPDVNCDGSPDQGDVACMILAVAGDVTCICQDPDFNLDGSADQGDVAALIGVVAGQPCP